MNPRTMRFGGLCEDAGLAGVFSQWHSSREEPSMPPNAD
jgi:hypothetical protein